MKVVDMIKKVFIGGTWFVGYREKNREQYQIIAVNDGWIADPFLFEYKGEHYLFVEYVRKTKGEIACYKFIQGKPIFQQVVISEPYHLSYPCVFTYGNDIYMIPESADNRSINLYKAMQFPHKWEKVAQLSEGVFYDTTYVSYNGKDYLISYSPQKGSFALNLFAFDIGNMRIEPIAEKRYEINIGRPAGNLFSKDNYLIRPAQDCERKYGEKLFFYRVTAMEKGKYEEQLESMTTATDVGVTFQRIHTYNSDNKYEVVDFFLEKFQPLRSIDILTKKVKQRFG